MQYRPQVHTSKRRLEPEPLSRKLFFAKGCGELFVLLFCDILCLAKNFNFSFILNKDLLCKGVRNCFIATLKKAPLQIVSIDQPLQPFRRLLTAGIKSCKLHVYHMQTGH